MSEDSSVSRRDAVQALDGVPSLLQLHSNKQQIVPEEGREIQTGEESVCESAPL